MFRYFLSRIERLNFPGPGFLRRELGFKVSFKFAEPRLSCQSFRFRDFQDATCASAFLHPSIQPVNPALIDD